MTKNNSNNSADSKTDYEKLMDYTTQFDEPIDKLFNYVVSRSYTSFVIFFLSINMYYVINNPINNSYEEFMFYLVIYGVVYSIISHAESLRYSYVIYRELDTSKIYKPKKTYIESFYQSLPMFIVVSIYLFTKYL